MRILYELVTVFRELKALLYKNIAEKPLGKPGRLLDALIYEPGDLPYVISTEYVLRPRVIGCICMKLIRY